MTNIQYGLISRTDANTLEKTIDLICDEFNHENIINFCEIGVYSGSTGTGVGLYLNINHHKSIYSTGIDNNKDNEPIIGYYDNLIIGNSNEVYNQLEDNSQHLIVQDANHSYPNAIQDFFCYMRKVKVGGYMWWHDVAIHSQGKDWQRMGDINDSDMSIAVRKALTDIGLFDNKFEGWEFIMEDADINDNCGGCAVFKRVK